MGMQEPNLAGFLTFISLGEVKKQNFPPKSESTNDEFPQIGKSRHKEKPGSCHFENVFVQQSLIPN